MNKRQAHVLQSLRSAQTFIDTNVDVLPSEVKRGAKAKLDTTIARLTNHVTNQTGDHLLGMGLTRTKRALRKALIGKHMAPIARIAEAELPDSPEMEPLRMPIGGLSAARLVGYAEGMARAAEPFAATFIDWGLSPDFIAELRQAGSALLASIDERTVARGNRHGATEGIEHQIRAGRYAVRVLDTFVKSTLDDDPVLVEQWITVSRVGRVPGRKARVADADQSPAPITAQPASPITEPSRLLGVPMPMPVTGSRADGRIELTQQSESSQLNG